MVSVKTKEDIPKGKIFEIMDEIRQVTIPAPVAIGDVVIADCAGTGVPVIATKNVAKA
jgi:CxxC motif-containing protein